MLRASPRCLVRTLVCGLLVSACGGTSDEAGSAPSEENLGTQESAMCSLMSITGLSLEDISSYGGVLAGGGSWATSSYANSTYMEFYVDNVLRSEQRNPGTYDSTTSKYNGSWSFSGGGITCGSHTFLLKAYPRHLNSAGAEEVCKEAPQTLTQTVVQGCPTATVSCSRSTSTVTCKGVGSGGTGGSIPLWREETENHLDSSTYSGPWFQGNWTQSFYCPVKTRLNAHNGRLLVQFKVRDNSGMDSAVATIWYPCMF